MAAPASSEKKKLAEAIQLRAVETVPYWPAARLYLVRGVRGDVDGILNAAIPVYWNIGKN